MTETPPERRSTLARRFLLGSVYLTVGTWTGLALSFAITIAIARVLGPASFGFYAFVFSINELLELLGGFAVGTALIQSREPTQRLYDTAYVLAVLLGLVGLVAALLIAPALYHLHSERAAWFIVVLAVSRIGNLMAAVHLAKMQRELRYAPVSFVNVTAVVAAHAGALVIALFGFGPWSLLARDVLAGGIAFVIAALLSGYRSRGEASRAEGVGLIRSVVGIYIPRTVDIALERVDRLAVGLHFGDRALGVYSQARTFAELGLVAVKPTASLALNLYSRLQDQPARLTRAFELVNYFVIRLVAAGASVLVVAPRELVGLVLGAPWMGTAPILRWLGAYAVLVPILDNVKQLLYARAAVREGIAVRVVQLCILGTGIGIATHLNELTIVAAALLVACLAGLALGLYLSRDVAAPSLASIFVRPVLALAVTCTGLLLLLAHTRLADAPRLGLIALPPLTFTVLIVLLERARLLRELTALRGHLTGSGGTKPIEAARVET